MTWSQVSQSSRLYMSELLATGMRKYLEQLGQSGIDGRFIEGIEKLIKEINDLNYRQESLKAELKTTTAVINARFKELEKNYRRGKKIVKMEMEQAMWRAFGIPDKR